MNPKNVIMTGFTALLMTTASAQASHHKQISDTTAKNATKVLTNSYDEVGEKNSTIAEDTLYKGDQHGNDHHDLMPSLNNVDGVTFETETAIKTAIEVYMHHISEQLSLEYIQMLNKDLGLSAEISNQIEEIYHSVEGHEALFADELEVQLGIFFRKDIKQGLEFVHHVSGGVVYLHDVEKNANEIEKHDRVAGIFATTMGIQKRFGEEGEKGILGGRVGVAIENKETFGTANVFGQYNHNNISAGANIGYTLSDQSLHNPKEGIDFESFLSTRLGKTKSFIIKLFGGINQGAGYGGVGVNRYPSKKKTR